MDSVDILNKYIIKQLVDREVYLIFEVFPSPLEQVTI